MKKLIALILFVGLVVFLYKSCPDKEAHTEALSEVMPEFLNEQLSSIGIESTITDNAEIQAVLKAVGPAIIDVDSYFLFSIGRENVTGENNMISLGIGGHVFTFNDEIVKKAYNLYQNAAEKF